MECNNAIFMEKGGDRPMSIDFERYKIAFEILRLLTNGESLKSRLQKKEYRNIVFYGASEIADIVLKLCRKEGIDVIGICDSKIIKDGWDYLGYRMLTKDTLVKMHDITVIVSAIGYSDEIKKDLDDLGLKNVVLLREAIDR